MHPNPDAGLVQRPKPILNYRLELLVLGKDYTGEFVVSLNRPRPAPEDLICVPTTQATERCGTRAAPCSRW